MKIAGAVRRLPGDARDLSGFDDGAFDLVVCNAVVPLVGGWAEMKKAAAQARRVGRRGWIEFPAYEFPVALFGVPFAHWLSYPAQIGLLNLFGGEVFKTLSVDEQYDRLEHMRPLPRAHVQRLFPKVEISTERLILPRRHIAVWRSPTVRSFSAGRASDRADSSVLPRQEIAMPRRTRKNPLLSLG